MNESGSESSFVLDSVCLGLVGLYISVCLTKVLLVLLCCFYIVSVIWVIKSYEVLTIHYLICGKWLPYFQDSHICQDYSLVYSVTYSLECIVLVAGLPYMVV